MPAEESPDAQYDRLKRQLQETILTGYPNPERKGCPGDAVLRGLAERYLDEGVQEDPNWHHVTHCSPCYREFLDFRADMRREAKRRRVAAGLGLAAATLAAIGAAVYFTRPAESLREERPQIAELTYRPRIVDLENRSTTRSGTAKEDTKPVLLGRGPEELTIRLPFGSRPGTHEIQILKVLGQPLLTTEAHAELTDGTTSMKARWDLSSVEPGSYLLAIRRPPYDWSYYPAEVR
jgi:hypothetical protein